MTRRRLLSGALVFVLFFPLGCSGLWKSNAIHIETTSSVSGMRRSLVVLFPGFGGKGVQFEQQGFIDAMREHGLDADVVTLNIRPRIYFHDEFVDIFRKQVILPAKSDGYKEIYLIGISMGGHGVLLYATKYPNDIEAIFVLSPFISGSRQSNAIVKAGGLENYKDCPFIGWSQACRLWMSLKEYVSDPKRAANIFLGFGKDDVFAEQSRILGELLPPENVFTVEGEHDWPTWKQLWLLAMDRFQAIKAQRMGPQP